MPTVNRGNYPNDPNSSTLYDAFGNINDAFETKVDKVIGKGLSTLDFTPGHFDMLDNADEHAISIHAPSNSQKNSDITNLEIQAKLIGDVSTHSHNALLEKAQSEVKSIGSIDSSYTISIVDAGRYIRSIANTAINVNIPTHAVVAIPINSIITIRQAGMGVVTINPANTTLNGPRKTGGQHKSLQIIKISNDVWDIEGGVE